MKKLASLMIASLCAGASFAQVTDVFDFATFTDSGTSSLTIGGDPIEQTGTNASTVYLIDNPSNGAGVTLDLKGRFAVDNAQTAAKQMRWMWRDSGNAHQDGLAGNWNGNGEAVASYNLSVLNLVAGDLVTITYNMQSGKAAQLYPCDATILTEELASGYLESGTTYTVAQDGNLDIYCTNNNMAIRKIEIVSTPKVAITDTWDLAAFVAGGAPTLTLGADPIAQSGTNAHDVYLIDNPTNNAGTTLNLKGRLAVDYGPSAAYQMRWMWRADAANGFKNGLAGNWNSKGEAVASYNGSVLGLSAGDIVTLTYTMQSGKAAQLYPCDPTIIAEELADGYMVSGTPYTITRDGNLDFYCTNNNMAINKLEITSTKVVEDITAPAFAITAVNGGDRQITIESSETNAGNATVTYYTVDGTEPTAAATEYNEPFFVTAAMTENDTVAVKAVTYKKGDLETVSPVATYYVAVGQTIQLNAPVIEKVGFDPATQLTTLVVTADQSSVLCAPACGITFVAVDGTASQIAPGDTILSAVGTVTACAVAEGYAPSATTSFEVSIPLVLNKVWSEDFYDLAVNQGYQNNPVISGEDVFSANGVTMGTVVCGKTDSLGVTDIEINKNFGIQTGTNWLMRAQGGLYNYNSGARSFGVRNLKAGMVLKLATSNGVETAGPEANIVANPSQSAADTVAYDILADGNVAFKMTRYYYVRYIGVYTKEGYVYSPDFAVVGYDGVNPKVEITSITPNVDLYYAVAKQDTIILPAVDGTDSLTFEMQPFSEFQKYEGVITLNAASVIKAYAVLGDQQSAESESALIELAPEIKAPAVAIVAEEGLVKIALTDVNPATVAAKLYVQTPESEAWNEVEGEYVVDAAAYGWYEFKAVADGIGESAVNTSVYVDARETYNNTYAAVRGEFAAIPVGAADVEYAAGVVVAGEYPAEDVAISGIQYFHKNVHANYNGLVLPFAFNVGTSVVTDAAGNALTYGEDYKIYKFAVVNTTAIPTAAAAKLLTEENANAEECYVAEGTGITANSKVYLVPADKYVGQDLIFQSAAGLSLPVAQIATFNPGTTYRIIANQQFAEYALPNNAYVISADGTQLECVAAGTILAPFEVAIQIKDAVVGSTIALGSNSFTDIKAIETKVEAQAAFDLQGRAAGKDAKGLLIQGNKVIFK